MPVFVHNPAKDFSASVVVEVGIDIGKIHTVGIQETFEKQIIFQGIYFRYSQAVCHNRTCRRTTSRSHNYAKLFSRGVNEVLNYEKVSGETHGLHYVELKLYVLRHIGGNGVAIAFLGSVVCKFCKIVGFKFYAVYFVESAQAFYYGVGVFFRQRILTVFVGCEFFVEFFLGYFCPPLFFGSEFFGYGEKRHDWSVVNAVFAHLIAHFACVRKGFGNVGKHFVHFLTCLEPLLFGVSHAGWVVEVLTCGKTQKMVVSFGRFLVFKVAVVGANKFYAVLFCQFNEFCVGFLLQGKSFAIGKNVGVFDFVALEFQIIVIAKDTFVPFYGFACAVHVSFQNFGGNFARNTS